MGRSECPYDNGVMTLMEYANSVYSRGVEINMMIHRAEATAVVSKGSPAYKFRTGELRDFIDLAKGAMELGSRRLTAAQLAIEMREELM